MRWSPSKNQYVRGDDVTVVAADGAIPIADGVVEINKSSAAALTLAPPAAGDEGIWLTITATTAFAHTVTITEGIGGKGAAFDVITFAAIGDTISLRAAKLHWVPGGAPYGAVIS